MMKSLKYIIAAAVISVAAEAQQVNTLYFMNNVQERSEYNPAFQPEHDIYVDLPVLPNFRLGFGHNSLKLNDIIYNQNVNGFDSTITFLHPSADRDKFYKKLKKNTTIDAGMTLNILNFGFRFKEKNFLTFGVNEKFMIVGNLPKDLFSLVLFGTDSTRTKSYDLSKLGISSTMYTEFSVGYSRVINDKWTVGGKAKYLMGQANFSTDFEKLKVKAGLDEWQIKGSGKIRASLPDVVDIPISEDNTVDYGHITTDFGKFSADDIFTSNWGLGLDLGVTYNVLPCLQLSAAVTDLGFIRWNSNTTTAQVAGGYTFNGFDYGIDGDIDGKWNQIKEDFENAFNKDANHDHYTTFLSTRLNVGAEYNVWDNRFGLGLLSSTLFYNKNIMTELTASANLRPFNWLSTTVSYTILNGQYNTFGAGLQFRLAPWNMFIAVDRIPLHFTKEYIPSQTKHANIQAGFIFELGWKMKKKDADKDGVSDKKDLCPDTPFGYIVDKKGCTIDSDSDGVADNVDKCPETPIGVTVDSLGCPIDTDNDSVPDYLDKCPDTPEGIAVDENGCPFDADGDGVADYLDKCPKTPIEARGKVDAKGCPLDTDEDGVPDYLDQCPNSAKGYVVDEKGCTEDADGDGVPDDIDRCPNTPAEARGMVDANGCPLDSDGDGVADYEDKCPAIIGTKANFGCPEIKAAAKKIFQKAMKGIQFETGKDVILPSSYGILDQIAKIMKDNPEYKIDINGHTDNVGKPESNLKLSDKRANAVRNYLIKKGVEGERMTATGYGDTKPIADNATKAGKAQNRRVEFVVTAVEE